MTIAAKKLDELLRQVGGGKVAATKTGVPIRTLRDLRRGAQPRARTIAALAQIGITPADWNASESPAPALPPALDLAALESGELPSDDASDLLERLEALYSDHARAISERIRAASIALSLARRMPARASIEPLEDLARDVCLVDPTLRGLCDRRLDDARETPENPVTRILAWAHDVARRPDTADRAVTLAHALEARAQKVSADLGRTGDSGVDALASAVVKIRTPMSAELVAVFAKHGQEPRPLAPGLYSVTGHGYAALCAKNGWRPRTVNPPWALGPDGLLRCTE